MHINYCKNTKGKYIPQGGIYLIKEIFQQNHLDKFINQCFPDRGKQSLYSDSDLVLALCYSIYAGGTYFEDLNQLRDQINVPGQIELPSSDSVRYRIGQLAENNQEIVSKREINHEFNINNTLSPILAKLSVRLNPDYKRQRQMLDYDNTVISTEKRDSRVCYKEGRGYQPGVIFIGRNPVYIEGRNGNSPSAYLLNQTLERGINVLQAEGVKIGAVRIDAAAFQQDVFNLMHRYPDIKYYIRGRNAVSIWNAVGGNKRIKKATIGGKALEYFSHDWYTPGDINDENKCRIIVYRYEEERSQLDLYEGKYCYYVIYTNDRILSAAEIIDLFNQRGYAEQNFDRLKNDFNWAYPPFNNLAMNTVYLILTAMGCQLYYFLLRIISKIFHELSTETRMKRFIFLFVNVVVKWTFRGRRYVLNMYSEKPYYLLFTNQ